MIKRILTSEDNNTITITSSLPVKTIVWFWQNCPNYGAHLDLKFKGFWLQVLLLYVDPEVGMLKE